MIARRKSHKNEILEFLKENTDYKYRQQLEILFLLGNEFYSCVRKAVFELEEMIKNESDTLEKLSQCPAGYGSIFEHNGESYTLLKPNKEGGFDCRVLGKNEWVELPKDAKISRIF
jgi:hypothetical protein